MVYTIYIDDDFHGVINYNRMREGRTKRPIAFYSALCRTSCNSRRRIPSFFFDLPSTIDSMRLRIAWRFAFFPSSAVARVSLYDAGVCLAVMAPMRTYR